MPYTNVAKPTGTPYTKVNSFINTYDDSTVTYDSSSAYYDGYLTTAYTNLAKPTGGVVTIRAGMATGLLIPLTYAKQRFVESSWIKIAKPVAD